MAKKILVIGALGQIGTELFEALQEKVGMENVVASDIRENPENIKGIYEQLDVLDKDRLLEVVKKHQISEVYHLAAMLSATAEKKPALGWHLNMTSLFNVLDLAKEKHVEKIFWPSSIAVFGPNTPRDNTPQETVMNPNTVYGISKLAGESWCAYYSEKYGVDVRSVRYPGLIGYKSLPGGGTTDYAVDIFYHAKREEKYNCFLAEDMALPMMYLPEAIEATIKVMDTDKENIKINAAYNLAGISFSPKELYNEIKKHCPNFEITYQPDYRQEIASSWPSSIDDSVAQKDWGWKSKSTIADLVKVMLENIKS